MPQSGTYTQLSSRGAEDIYLTGNPQITYFKSVYKKHTNFAMDTSKIKIPKSDLKYTTETSTKVKIERDGDLVHSIYVGITIPSIYSTTEKFQWVKHLGNNIIDRVAIYINGLKIDEHYGEWMHIWNELNLTDDKKKIYYELIGHTEEFYDPEHAYKRNGFYPDSSLISTDNLNYNKPPSIPSKTLYVPLNFWFCRNTGLALPLVSLQSSEVELEIVFKPIYKLYTLYDIGTKKRIQPDISNNAHHIKNFMSETVHLPTARSDIGDWDFNAHLEITYIYLDTNERKLFARKPHDYLIQTVKRISEENLKPGIMNLNIKASHPTTELIIVAQRSDAKTRNDYNNYTNWETPDKPPWQGIFLPEYNKIAGNIEITENSYWKALETGNTIRFSRDSTTGALILSKYVTNQYVEIGRFDTATETNPAIPSEITNNPISQTYNNNTKDIIQTMNILLDGNRKIDEDEGRSNEFFSKLQVYQHHKGNPSEGILVYSFAISPEDTVQPSGYCNLTRIQDLLLRMKTVEPEQTSGVYNYKFNINIYLVSYNILSILNGQGGLKFAL